MQAGPPIDRDRKILIIFKRSMSWGVKEKDGIALAEVNAKLRGKVVP